MKTKRRKKAFPIIARRIIALALVLWLLAAGLLTWAVAEDFRGQIETRISHIAEVAGRRPKLADGLPEDLPGSMEVGMIDYLSYPYLWIYLDTDPLLPIAMDFKSVGSDDWLWGKWDLYFGFEVGSAYYQDDTLLMDSGNYITFVYTDQDNWYKQNLDPMGRAYVDLDTLPMGYATVSMESWPLGDMGLDMWLGLVRMTGYFEGNQFHPVTMDRGDTKYGSEVSLEQMCQLDGRENLLWYPMIDERIETDRELVTIYTWQYSGIRHETGPVTVDGVHYDSLQALAAGEREHWGEYESSNLQESVYIWRYGHEDNYGPYTYAVAVRCWPLQYAAFRLIPVYLVSFAVTMILVLLLLWSIRRNLTQPMAELTDKIRRNAFIEPDADWAEPRALQEYYETTRQTLHENGMQIAQLNTALEYARNAEESRRQLVSNITHELKTPLAVIHSYAEGLQAGIAGEKRDQYLNVILEESEKMDAMVLQMLDLSRLEAGRVRLRSDSFSLAELTRRVAEKLDPLIRARELEIVEGLIQNFTVTADEARMEQVITNLMTNAIKYSPPGGKIHLNIYSHMGQAYFRIENYAAHLSDEALRKVWDSFYRADPARTEPGTGLGLTIVKTIVELHGGSCSVRNTTLHDGDTAKTGVEFGFQISV